MDYFELLKFFGVPQRVVKSLRRHYHGELPKAFPADMVPAGLPTELYQLFNEDDNWVFLFGPPGSGKSTRAAFLLACYLRMLHALGNGKRILKRMETEPTFLPPCTQRCLYVRVTKLFQVMKKDFAGGSSEGQELYKRAEGAELLVLDDLTSAPSPWELSQLDILIDQRYAEQRRTIITSNHTLGELSNLMSERISRRIEEASSKHELEKVYSKA